MVDIEQAVQAGRNAVVLSTERHPHYARLLYNLAVRLVTQYSRTHAMVDLDEAIQLGRQAVHLTPKDNKDRSEVLMNLGNFLSKRYSVMGSIHDLQETVQLATEAVNATPEGHPEHADYITNLGAQLAILYSRTGLLSDLEEAIRVGRKAVEVAQEGHRHRANVLHNLGTHLTQSYLRTGSMTCLEESIQLKREAVRMTPSGHPDAPVRLDGLGLTLGLRYSRTREEVDLEEAIRVGWEAVNGTPENQPGRSGYLNNLGARLGDRYAQAGTESDLKEAIRLSIRVSREAFSSMPKDHPDRVSLLNNLGLQLGDRYARIGADGDLNESIELIRESVKMTPESHISRAKRLNNLQIRLSDRFLATGAEVDLKEAIRVGRKAVDETPEGHPDRALVLSNLGNRLGDLFERTGDIVDLNEAIRICQEAIDAMPKTHSRRAEWLINLGNRLSDRYRKTGAISDFEAITAQYQAALCHSSSVASTRITAGRKVLRCYANKLRWQQAYDASAIAVPLIPKLTLRSLENSDKQHILGEVVGFASDAAAVALHAGKGPLVALNFLEQGRGVLGTSLEELRTDVLELKEKHPELAEHFVPAAWQAQSHRRYKAGDDLDKLIDSIRQKADFHDFLLAPSQAEMMGAASCGPIIVINVSEFRCDAILIQQQGIQSVSLPRLNRQDIEEKSQKGLGSTEILEWLWDAIADPVLNALGFTDPPQGTLPHVWWIPTGPLAKFPIHAAGYHMKGQAVLDRVMSSYSSSVKAMIHTRRRPTTPSTSAHALLVAMEHTPGRGIRLPFAPKEIEVLHNLCKCMKLYPIEPGRRKEDVISHLPRCKIFHFAGHGYTNGTDPSKSHLLLQDEPLTVANLLEIDLRKSPPFLAYLSACGTGRIKDERFVDESIHLISGCQLAGFRHVIGTLWEVNDESCVEMAKLTYEGIRNGGLTDESVCQGLHAACRELRDQWLAIQTDTSSSEPHSGKVRMPRDVVLCDGLEGATTLHWVPYVHFGV
ncbi:CHAT domain-containing protein [Ilyonectria robusta]|uniref:CHAT domain-containing protein n=1 Tax=Ilyonectria robusta TaxID=1079257 RepID=UPI001E8ED44F|nr:CHAT domain-containing protein [Ilyonectria robusta]KAH8736103.1 CHAT domain-containing protein [Ilyonectria robusta]